MKQPRPSYRELLSGREFRSTVGPQSLKFHETLTTCVYHGVIFEYPAEVMGYHLVVPYGSGDRETELPPDPTNCRVWLQSANPNNALPDYVIPYSDTKTISDDLSGVDLSWTSYYVDEPEIRCDFTYDIPLANPVPIVQGGFFWVGFLYDSNGGGNFLASDPAGLKRGKKDLRYTGSRPANGADLNAWTLPQRLTTSNTIVPAELYASIDIWLITQPLTPTVPYGG